MKRRWISIPVVACSAVALMLTVPIWLPIAAVFDMALGRRLATVRAFTFATAYAWAEVAGLWRALRAGQDPEANYALQRAWALGLWNLAVGLYQLDVRVDGADQIEPGPLLLLPRHSSLADTLLPITVLGPKHMRPRYVLKRELLWDPCLDVVGNRVPNAFVQRSGDTENAIAGVAALAKDMGPHDAIVLYPEGTRFSPERQARALARVPTERRARCATWRHVMPPHSGGCVCGARCPQDGRRLLCAPRPRTRSHGEGLAERVDDRAARRCVAVARGCRPDPRWESGPSAVARRDVGGDGAPRRSDAPSRLGQLPAADVAAAVRGAVDQLLKGLGHAQRAGVPHADEQLAGAADGDVQATRIVHETQLLLGV